MNVYKFFYACENCDISKFRKINKKVRIVDTF